MTDLGSELDERRGSQEPTAVSLLEALRHDSELFVGVRHNEDRILTWMSYGAGVLKIMEAVEAAEVEAMHKLRMERVPTGNAPRYSMQRTFWELAKKQREAAVAALDLPATGLLVSQSAAAGKH